MRERKKQNRKVLTSGIFLDPKSFKTIFLISDALVWIRVPREPTKSTGSYG